MFSGILKLLRIEHWSKNLFIFLPIFFDGQVNDWNSLRASIVVFFGFSLVASSIYCLNDIIDKEDDKKHPKKRNRPIASEKVSISTAIVLIFLLVLGGFGILYFGNIPSIVILVVATYFFLNIAYCFRLKQVAILDVFIIATGFVLRVVAGGYASDVLLSHWIIMMTFLLALFLGFSKRLDDVKLFENDGMVARKNIVRYNVDFLNSMIIITSTITVMAYIMYTVSSEVLMRFDNNYIYLTSSLVILGVFRYLQATMVDNTSGSPTRILLNDNFIQACILLWVLSFILIIYVL